MSLKTILFAIIPFCLMIIISVGMPFYRMSVMNKAGNKVLALAKKNPFSSYFTTGIAFILLLLSVKFDFGRLNFVIPLCGVLGIFIATRESAFYPVNGIYENLMIVGSDILWYKDIDKILTEEESNHPDYIIMIKPKKGRNRQFIFDNANEALEVLKILKEKVSE